MTRIAFLSALGVIALVAAGCGTGSSATPTPELPGTSWTVTTVDGAPVDAASPPTILFGADGNVGGTTGCNSYSAPYKLDGSSIEVGLMAMTLMLCEGSVGVQETVFGGALQKATSWVIGADGNLTLSGGGDIVAAPAAG